MAWYEHTTPIVVTAIGAKEFQTRNVRAVRVMDGMRCAKRGVETWSIDLLIEGHGTVTPQPSRAARHPIHHRNQYYT